MKEEKQEPGADVKDGKQAPAIDAKEKKQESGADRGKRIARGVGFLILIVVMAFFALKYTGFNQISMGNIFYGEMGGSSEQSDD